MLGPIDHVPANYIGAVVGIPTVVTWGSQLFPKEVMLLGSKYVGNPKERYSRYGQPVWAPETMGEPHVEQLPANTENCNNEKHIHMANNNNETKEYRH